MTNTIIVSNSEELHAAYANAQGGETILLKNAGEKYTFQNQFTTELNLFSETVTITSYDTEDPAVIERMFFSNQGNIEISNLSFEGSVEHSTYNDKLEFWNSENITIKNNVFKGDIETAVSDFDEATHVRQMHGGAIHLLRSSSVTIEDNEISNLLRGIGHRYTEDVDIKNNHLHHIAEDGIRGGGAENLNIEGNEFTEWLGINNDVLFHQDVSWR